MCLEMTGAVFVTSLANRAIDPMISDTCGLEHYHSHSYSPVIVYGSS